MSWLTCIAYKHRDRDGEKHRKKKRKHEATAPEDDDDAMWVEAETPDAVKSMAVDVQSTGDSMTTTRGRKRAIDFL